MLKYLAKEKANVHKLEKLQRKAENLGTKLVRMQLTRAAMEVEDLMKVQPPKRRTI